MLVLAGGASWGGDAVGVWKMNPRRSTYAADPVPRNFTLRIERHATGEVFTVERTEQDGRSSSDSTILFLDGKPRDYQDLECSGSQSSRRVDSRTVEILRKCEDGERTWVIRRPASPARELVLEITERTFDGRRCERRLVLERQ